MSNEEFQHLQNLVIAQTTLIASLVNCMSKKGLIDGEEVLSDFDRIKSMLTVLTK